MEIIIWFNFIVSLFFIGRFLYRQNRIHFSWSKTFWCNKVYGLNIMWNKYPMYTGQINARGLFYIPIRNSQKTDEWDQRMFKSGEYKKYKK